MKREILILDNGNLFDDHVFDNYENIYRGEFILSGNKEVIELSASTKVLSGMTMVVSGGIPFLETQVEENSANIETLAGNISSIDIVEIEDSIQTLSSNFDLYENEIITLSAEMNSKVTPTEKIYDVHKLYDTQRTYDAENATEEDLRTVVGTLISDLQDNNILSWTKNKYNYFTGTNWIDISQGYKDYSNIATNNGYVEWKQAKINRKYPLGSYVLIGEYKRDDFELGTFDETRDFIRINRIENNIIVTTYGLYDTPPDDSTVRFIFSPSGHSIEINGETANVEYISGNSDQPTEIKELQNIYTYSFSNVGNYSNGFIYDFKLVDSVSGALVDLSHPNKPYANYIISKTDDKRKYYIESDGINQLGFYDSPLWVENTFVEDIKEAPFAKIPDSILDKTPEDSDRYYLLDKTTGEPYIPRLPDGWQYPYFSEKPPSELTRNPNCWYYKKAMTCFSIWSDWHGFSGHLTLLSPRHALISEHIRDDFGPNEGTPFSTGYKYRSISFMDLSGNYQTVKPIDSITLGYNYETSGYDHYQYDLAVLTLDNEITLDVDYASFMTDSDIDNFDYRMVEYGCGPSKEGIFSLERLYQNFCLGTRDVYLRYGNESPKDNTFYWSRYNNKYGVIDRVGDSSSPGFIYHDEILYLMFLAWTQGRIPFSLGTDSNSINGSAINSLRTTNIKSLIQQAMNDMDDRNGYTEHFTIQEVPIS